MGRTFLLFLPLLSFSNAFIAFDCSAPSVNFTKIDITESRECVVADNELLTLDDVIQLVEINQDYPVDTISCKVTITRSIYACQHRYLPVTHGQLSYVKHLSQKECQDAHARSYIQINTGGEKMLIFDGIELNKRYTQSQTFSGWSDATGHCGGGTFIDPYGVFSNVVVYGQVDLHMKREVARVSAESEGLVLPSGVRCRYATRECSDLDGSQYFWDLISIENCKSHLHSVLYEGPATVIYPQGSTPWDKSVLTIATDSISASLQLTGHYKVCNMDSYTTEHPRLIIVRRTGTEFYYKQHRERDVKNLDIFSYINSKFVLLERNTRTNMKALYRSLQLQRCELAMNILSTRLTIAAISPGDFAYMQMGSPGYSATVLGEVIYITRCVPIEVVFRRTGECYHELAVSVHNRSLFMLPRTRLLQNHGTQIACNPILQPNYKIDDKWYATNNPPHEIVEPIKLDPASSTKWEYKSISNLAQTGLYSDHDLNELRSQIMYGSEKSALENVLIRGFKGEETNLQGMSLHNMIDDDFTSQFTDKISNRMWGYFKWFGNLSSGLIGILLVGRIIKWSIDTIVHGTSLYAVYGKSIWLLGAVWDSLTLCLLYAANRPDTTHVNIARDDDCPIVLVPQTNPDKPYPTITAEAGSSAPHQPTVISMDPAILRSYNYE